MSKYNQHSNNQLREIIWAQLPRTVQDRLYMMLETDAYRIKPPSVVFTWVMGAANVADTPLSNPVECDLERDLVTEEYTRIPEHIVALLCLTVA